MALIDVGRVCVKVRGRDAAGLCVVVDEPKDGKVLVDGVGVRRKLVSVLDIEPTPTQLKLKKDASSESVAKALGKTELPW